MNARIFLLLAIVSVALLLFSMAQIPGAHAAAPLLTEFAVSASPLNVTAESLGQIWVTLPAQNSIGKLVVTSTVDYHFITYTVPTLASEPYDLKSVSGKIWFTERLGNKIGRFDPGTAQFNEFTIPTANSQPTGIAVLSLTPTQVWFTERAGNKLGKLVFTSTVDYAFTEYALPAGYPNAQPEDLNMLGTDYIWFTAPNVSSIGYLRPALYPSSSAFEMFYSGGQPWSIGVDPSAYPWITERTGNRIGWFFPTTIQIFLWYNLPSPNRDPYDLVVSDRYAWFTEQSGNRVGQLDRVTRAIREFGLEAGSAPKGIAADSLGCLWIAESGRNKIASWCSPYFYYNNLPMIMRGS